MAVAVGRIEAVRVLIENGADVNAKYKWNQTPLHYAAFNNFTQIANLLLENGADICSRAIEDRSDKRPTPIDIAMSEGHYEIVEFLTAAGANECP